MLLCTSDVFALVEKRLARELSSLGLSMADAGEKGSIFLTSSVIDPVRKGGRRLAPVSPLDSSASLGADFRRRPAPEKLATSAKPRLGSIPLGLAMALALAACAPPAVAESAPWHSGVRSGDQVILAAVIAADGTLLGGVEARAAERVPGVAESYVVTFGRSVEGCEPVVIAGRRRLATFADAAVGDRLFLQTLPDAAGGSASALRGLVFCTE